jgi:polysaccharide chain length determinant protein (PEP-CTERM system associated)
MLGHRSLNVEDYMAILKRRWWIIAIPAVILPIAAVGITYFIPPQYVSQTLVLIDQQRVPENFVRPIVSEDIDSRIASMKQQIESRSSLQPIIDRYGLYANQKLSMDARIDLARAAIGIDPIHSEIARSNGLPGFYISFTASDPHTAQQVCGDITSLFTGANIKSRAEAAEGTTEFLKEQLDDAQRNLNDQDQKLADFERKYFGQLPSDEGNNISVLQSLNTQLEAVTQQLNNLDISKSLGESMLAEQTQQASSPSTPAAATAVTPQAEQKKLDDLLKREDELSAQYQPDYPDLKEVRRKIADLQKQMAQPAAPAPDAPAAPATTAASKGDSANLQQIKAALRAQDAQIQAKKTEQAQLQTQIRQYQARIQSTPQVEEESKQLNRDYQTSLAFYNNLLSQTQSAKEATDLEHQQEGEQFQVLDDANLPESPFYPKRPVFAGGGLGAGLALGLLIVALLEYKDTALRTERDVWAFTQLPTLAVIVWSGEVAAVKPSRLARLKRFFSRKKPKELLADATG